MSKPKHRMKTLGLTILRNKDGNPSFALVDQDSGQVINGIHALSTGQDVTTQHGFVEVVVKITVELIPNDDRRDADTIPIGRCRPSDN